MALIRLEPSTLALTIDVSVFNFADTSILVDEPLAWIGQERARQAAYFGLAMDQPDYNLFVLGEPGSGRSSLVRQAMLEVAANKPTPPDLCYLFNFDAPENPLALCLPAGAGNWLRQQLTQTIQGLQQKIAARLDEIQTQVHHPDQALIELDQKWLRSLLDEALSLTPDEMNQMPAECIRLERYLCKVRADILANLDLFCLAVTGEAGDQQALEKLLQRYQINVAVDNSELHGAPVIIEENPTIRSLIGSVGYRTENGVLVADFTHIRAGSLLKAHGGFLMLYLDDLLADAQLWERVCRLLRSRQLQIEAPSMAGAVTVLIEPEVINIDVKIILIGSREQYYALQEESPELARRFRVKVDFVASFPVDLQIYHAVSTFIARICQQFGLPHFSREAVGCLLEIDHRAAEDQRRLSADFSGMEAWMMESAVQCQMRSARIVEAADVLAAKRARTQRHNYPEQIALEAVIEGDIIITVRGEKIGQVNGLSVIDMGDVSFGLPARITAHTFAGESSGLVNIEREVGLSGPIHDKGVFILQHFLSAVFHHNAPLALNASVVFEQEYCGIEGDSASCAELYALLSALSGLPFRQGIAITGAINQHGEILPIGGVNEKIESFFNICEAAGLDGTQGVLIPKRNRHYLMLSDTVIQAVSAGMFHVYTFTHAFDGLELLSGFPAGMTADIELNEMMNYPQDTVLGYAQKTLRAYRAACQQPQQKSGYKRTNA